MKEIFQNNRFRFLAFVLLLGNAFLLPITADEAYYFSWSRDLSLGYYDHPPLVAWMMSAVSSEYLRTPFLLLVLAFVFLGKERSIGKFIFIPGVHLFLGGALPDTLMIIAGFMVLHSFRRWANSRNIVNAIILGVCIAALGYSKFHGILLIFSLAVGYWHLRKEWTLYLAIAIAFILLMPYLWWQMEMDWVTFRYHFSGRFGSSSFPSLLEYLTFGALLWWPMILFFRPLPTWGKALIISAILLFGWGAYNGSAEVHWLLVFMWVIPALELPDSKRTRNVAYLITILHALVWVPAVRDLLSLNDHFRDDVREINSKENVVFLDAYQDAAIYELATGKEPAQKVPPAPVNTPTRSESSLSNRSSAAATPLATDRLTAFLASGDGLLQRTVVLFSIAALPGIFEELSFRGVLQPILVVLVSLSNFTISSLVAFSPK